MEDIKNEVKIDINGIALGIYGFLMKQKLITPDEYHILRSQPIPEEKAEEVTEDGRNK